MAELKGSILVTGANGGLGSAFVANLLKAPQGTDHRGIYTVHNPSTANELKAVLSRGPKTHEHEILPLDLSSLESVRNLARDINARVADGTLAPIRALILNAGWQEAGPETLKPRTFTTEGYEANFGVNYLSNFLLSLLLLQSMDKTNGRIVTVSSWAHDSFDSHNNFLKIFDKEYQEMFQNTEGLAKGIEYTDDGFKAGMRRYASSKLLMVMFM
jgi:NAD(P)-dependent dehydrogenase (short-subunit alcohol dehydrogenase family)